MMRYPHRLKETRTSGGLGLVEVLVVVLIVGVLTAVATPSLMGLLERRRIMAVTQELAGLLSFARSEANANGDRVTVHLEKDPSNAVSCASVNIQHPSDECVCYLPQADMCKGINVPVLRVFQLKNSDGVSFEASATSWGKHAVAANQLTFERNQHYLDVTGMQITVQGARTGAQMRVELNTANRIRTCSPDGSIGGVAKCG
jgi:type IV fimbrial biogenesis protein FimT